MRASSVSAALLFGSLWGLAEATAGHALHALRVPGVAGFLMFPLGFFLMSRAYARNGVPMAALMTSWVAASVKLVDLLIPGADVMAVLNPAQAILLQGLAAAGLLSVFGAETTRRFGKPFSRKTEAVAAAGASLVWRAAHLVLGLLWTALFQAPNILQIGSAPLLRFLILDGLINGVVIFLLPKARPSLLPSSASPPQPLRFRLHPTAALACLVAAVIAEIAF